MKPTLLVLAAGMGSRYGGLKQLDGVGPSGETIMDYSVYDAVKAGFGKVVFVIRRDFEQDFMDKVASKYQHLVPVEVVFQGVDCLPEGFTCPEGRTKPWGTNHAVMMGKKVIHEPFAVINADDFYGAESFGILADALRAMEGLKGKYCMVGYRVGNTLSESGTVSRGVCQKNADGYLTDIVERTKIERIGGTIMYVSEDGKSISLEEQTPVSMNMWGFTPDYFEYSDEAFKRFLKDNLHSEKGEFYIPTVVNDLIKSGEVTCEILDTPSQWFGVTYAEDRPSVVAKLASLVEAGKYPHNLLK